jgi:hypothetical protein
MSLGFPKNFPPRLPFLDNHLLTANSQLPQILQHTIHASEFGLPNTSFQHFPSRLDSITLRGMSLLLIGWMCPAHLNLPFLIILTISDDLYSWYNSWLYLSRHSLFLVLDQKFSFIFSFQRCSGGLCLIALAFKSR